MRKKSKRTTFPAKPLRRFPGEATWRWRAQLRMERTVSPIRIFVIAATAIAWTTAVHPPSSFALAANIVLIVASAVAILDLVLVFGPSDIVSRWPWASTVLDLAFVSAWIVASGGSQSIFVSLAFFGLASAVLRNPPRLAVPVAAAYALVILVCAGLAHWYEAVYAVAIGAGLTFWTAVAYRDRRASLRDDLTGAFTRDYADFRLDDLYKQRAFPIALAVIDLDGFKGVNDTFGHPAGDSILIQAVRAIEGAIRQGDLLARSGGDEFTLVLPKTDAETAAVVADRVRVAIETTLFRHRRDMPPVRLTASVGIAVARDQTTRRSALISRADEQLYAAKQGGRNRVTM